MILNETESDYGEEPFPLPSQEARRAALFHQSQLTKPEGSLGRLEEIAVNLAAWFDDPLPNARPAEALIFAADHGVSYRGVSAYPREVTRAMVHNFLSGGAAAAVLARHHGIPLRIIDVGVDGGPIKRTGDDYVRVPVADAVCGDLMTSDAMDHAALEAAFAAGATAVRATAPNARVVILGEMGIGNTTVASALAASLLGGDASQWVGRGTGVSDAVLELKRKVITTALKRAHPESRPYELLRKLGGREIAALVGAMIEAARLRRAVVVDGFIVSTAALVATLLEPRIAPALVFAHRSAEAPHDRLLLALGARPLLDCQLRLGEASGGLLAFSLIEMACRLHREMATFHSAAVPNRCP
jgi:nicotinate-nucleotide--dimethylbenzimidazole phosphoribosyltransferase